MEGGVKVEEKVGGWDLDVGVGGRWFWERVNSEGGSRHRTDKGKEKSGR